MSAASQTKIFGISVGVDPKILVGGLFAVALLLYFAFGRNEGSSSSTSNPAPAANSVASTALPGATNATARRTNRRNRNAGALVDRGVLRIRPVDATHGDIDPTLRIDMLQRLRKVAEAPPSRSLFEIGEAAPSDAAIQKVNKVIMPAPVQSAVTAASLSPPPVQANIPLKFYGFVKSARRSATNRGLFLDGDNIVVASEGDVIDGRYLVVSLTSQQASMEDTQIKQGQTLPVVPEAVQQ